MQARTEHESIKIQLNKILVANKIHAQFAINFIPASEIQVKHGN